MEEYQTKGIRNVQLNRALKKILNIKEMIIQTQEAFRTSKQDQKRMSPPHVTIKTLTREDKGTTFTACKREVQSHT